MKQLLNKGITLLAIIGVIVIIGALGNVDYLTTVGKDYNLSVTIKSVVVGILLTVPAIIREAKIYIG